MSHLSTTPVKRHRKAGYIPDWLLARKDLSPRARLLAVKLDHFSGQLVSCAKADTLAEVVGADLPTPSSRKKAYARAMACLRQAKLVFPLRAPHDRRRVHHLLAFNARGPCEVLLPKKVLEKYPDAARLAQASVPELDEDTLAQAESLQERMHKKKGTMCPLLSGDDAPLTQAESGSAAGEKNQYSPSFNSKKENMSGDEPKKADDSDEPEWKKLNKKLFWEQHGGRPDAKEEQVAPKQVALGAPASLFGVTGQSSSAYKQRIAKKVVQSAGLTSTTEPSAPDNRAGGREKKASENGVRGMQPAGANRKRSERDSRAPSTSMDRAGQRRVQSRSGPVHISAAAGALLRRKK